MTQLGHILSKHEPLDQSGVTGGGLDQYNALFVNMDSTWTERFGNHDCLVNYVISITCTFNQTTNVVETSHNDTVTLFSQITQQGMINVA